MTAYKVVVDGSNIATEGRSLPSLGQLDEAVRAFIEEHPQADVLVIVDTTFAHRISPAEQPLFEAAYAAGEIICPPAGTIGRGDSFILKVADKLGATIFSNDSFQEFHGEYHWLFEKSRLLGGKPVPGLGWVFMDRTPVRGPKSREAVRDAKRSKARVGSPEASRPMPIPKAPPPFLLAKASSAATQAAIAAALAEPDPDPRRKKPKGRDRDKRSDVRAADRDDRPSDRTAERAQEKEQRKAEKAARQDAERAAAIARADGEGSRRKRRRKKGRTLEANLEPINDSLVFITFIAEHTIGSEVAGIVDSYSSHGFYVLAAGARCYVPLTGLVEPTPRSAKEVVRRGEEREWIVRVFDPPRRGIELALVGSPAASSPLPATAAHADQYGDDEGSDETATATVAAAPSPETGTGPRRSSRAKPASADAPAASAEGDRPTKERRPPRRAAGRGARSLVPGAAEPDEAYVAAGVEPSRGDSTSSVTDETSGQTADSTRRSPAKSSGRAPTKAPTRAVSPAKAAKAPKAVKATIAAERTAKAPKAVKATIAAERTAKATEPDDDASTPVAPARAPRKLAKAGAKRAAGARATGVPDESVDGTLAIKAATRAAKAAAKAPPSAAKKPLARSAGKPGDGETKSARAGTKLPKAATGAATQPSGKSSPAHVVAAANQRPAKTPDRAAPGETAPATPHKTMAPAKAGPSRKSTAEPSTTVARTKATRKTAPAKAVAAAKTTNKALPAKAVRAPAPAKKAAKAARKPT